MGEDLQDRSGSGELLLVMAHGAGSTADFLTRAFPADVCGVPVKALEDRTGDTGRVVAAMLQVAADASPARILLGGVSMGAHAAALAYEAAAPGQIAGCVLVMPGWTGPPQPDSPTAVAAAEVAAAGPQEVLRRLEADAALRSDWVTAELRRAWERRPTLAAELRNAARGRAPTLGQLSRIAVPVLVLGLADDPFHPLTVARAWAAAAPQSELVVLPRGAPQGDRAGFAVPVGRWVRRRISAPR